MHKIIQYLLVFVVMATLISTAPAQDAFDKTVTQIKALEAKLEQNRKRVDQKTAEFRKNHKDNAPQDMFESDAMYKERMAKLDVTVSEHRLKLLKQHIEADQIEHARLHREHIPSTNVTITLDRYNANDEFFPITIETPTERFTEKLTINRNDARILYENWDKVDKQGYLTVGPAPAHKRILAKVTLKYPEIWRQPVALYFNDADTMVLIPAGDFEMGSNDKDAEEDEKPVHTVYLDAFYIDKYEVTIGQYKQFVQETGHRAPDCFNMISDMDQEPVVGVSWYDAMAYAKWTGKRLPTEAEWEKAARGGLVGAKYPWGNTAPNGTQCNFADKSRGTDWADKNADDGYAFIAPVGSFPANGYGLHDIGGNVSEWCLDEYQRSFYASSSQRRNPFSKGNIDELENSLMNVRDCRTLSGDVNFCAEHRVARRVLRDGFWGARAQELLTSRRSGLCPVFTASINGVGFRCVRPVTP